MRDEVVDFVRRWPAKSEIRGARFVAWLDISTSKFYNWRKRYGKVNEHNAWTPRERWLEQWEKQAILDFHREHPLDGYRRAIVHWDLRESMKEAEVEVNLQRARELQPQARPRIISDLGPAILGEGLQGIHSRRGHDARQNVALLSAIERQDRALASIARERMHSALDTACGGRSAFAQRDRLSDAQRYARRTANGDP